MNMNTIYNIKVSFLCCSEQTIIEFKNLKEIYIRRNYHFRVDIWYETEESKTSSDLSDLGDLIKSPWVLGTNRRHVLRTFNGM